MAREPVSMPSRGMIAHPLSFDLLRAVLVMIVFVFLAVLPARAAFLTALFSVKLFLVRGLLAVKNQSFKI